MVDQVEVEKCGGGVLCGGRRGGGGGGGGVGSLGEVDLYDTQEESWADIRGAEGVGGACEEVAEVEEPGGGGRDEL